MNRFERLEKVRIKAQGKWNIILDAKSSNSTPKNIVNPDKKLHN